MEKGGTFHYSIMVKRTGFRVPHKPEFNCQCCPLLTTASYITSEPQFLHQKSKKTACLLELKLKAAVAIEILVHYKSLTKDCHYNHIHGDLLCLEKDTSP